MENIPYVVMLCDSAQTHRNIAFQAIEDEKNIQESSNQIVTLEADKWLYHAKQVIVSSFPQASRGDGTTWLTVIQFYFNLCVVYFNHTDG